MPNLFISYRRDDAGGHAGRLSDRLVARFGDDSVFVDVDDIKPGQNFLEAIEQTLSRCEYMLAVIGPHWLELLRARLTRHEDFVRHEIVVAMSRGMTVIPVLVGAAKMPDADDLPPELAAFARCQAVEIRDNRFGEDTAALVSFLAGSGRTQRVDVMGMGFNRRALIMAVAALVIATIGVGWFSRHRPASPVARPSLAYGQWTLRDAVDVQGKNWSNSVLQITSQQDDSEGLLLTGRFTWRLENQLIGTEEISGRYLDRTRQIILEGSRVSAPARLAVGSYSAVLGPDERALLEGRWGSTAQNEPGYAGKWEATR